MIVVVSVTGIDQFVVQNFSEHRQSYTEMPEVNSNYMCHKINDVKEPCVFASRTITHGMELVLCLYCKMSGIAYCLGIQSNPPNLILHKLMTQNSDVMEHFQ